MRGEQSGANVNSLSHVSDIVRFVQVSAPRFLLSKMPPQSGGSSLQTPDFGLERPPRGHPPDRQNMPILNLLASRR